MIPNTEDERAFENEVISLKESMSRAMWKANSIFGFDNSKGTLIYDYQVEYCYIIDSIQRDSKFIAHKQLNKLRDLINKLRRECSEAAKMEKK